MPKNTTFFSNKLIAWYLENKRSLPWRKTKDPYTIWLSEIILQQTRVEQGLPYYVKFLKVFPTVYELAGASEEQVLKLWQGLGYYSRARNLHTTAKYVVEELQGVFPKSYKELLNLKGVGDYTASAIASICFDEPTAVVDGNVYRVLARVFGIDTPINSTKGIKEFKLLAQSLLDTTRPGTFNQAIMEFGARHCVPKSPDCSTCIFLEQCLAHKNKSISLLPVKLKKTAIKKHYFNYIVPLSSDQKTILHQRTQKGIWQQLYQFPLIESTEALSMSQLKALVTFQELSKKLRGYRLIQYNDEPIIHKLSHKHLHTTFWLLETDSLSEVGISFAEVSKYPVPILLGNFISNFSSFNP